MVQASHTPGFGCRKSPGAHLLSVLAGAWFPQGQGLSAGCVCMSEDSLCLSGALWFVLWVLLEREEPEEGWDLFWCLVRSLSTS